MATGELPNPATEERLSKLEKQVEQLSLAVAELERWAFLHKPIGGEKFGNVGL